MENYIHRENLALLKKRLAEAQDETTRKVILKLLAEEEAEGGHGLSDRGTGAYAAWRFHRIELA
jgi:hypothetical protein